jgi:hypothetical protein
LMF